jgi:hypothetical protein
LPRFVSGSTVLAVISTSRLALAFALVPFGFFNGLLDVSMNSLAAVFERRTGRAVMSSFHALFSLGALLGTLFGAASLAANFSPSAHVLIGVIPFLVAGCLIHRGLIQEKQQDHSHGFFISFPSGKVLPLAIMAFVFLLAEGWPFWLDNTSSRQPALAWLASDWRTVCP